jgi:hypothetical protein
MIEASKIVNRIRDIAERYGLKILYLDISDVTLLLRIGFTQEMFIQIYANVSKEKINMALVVAGERIYGIDKEGGYYHEHPFENPSLHIEAEQIDIEDFVVKSLEFLRRKNLI